MLLAREPKLDASKALFRYLRRPLDSGGLADLVGSCVRRRSSSRVLALTLEAKVGPVAMSWWIVRFADTGAAHRIMRINRDCSAA